MKYGKWKMKERVLSEKLKPCGQRTQFNVDEIFHFPFAIYQFSFKSQGS
jgi:hypothetical protein